MFLPHPRVKVSIVGSLRDREVACSASDRRGSNFEFCVWRTVSSQSSHHPQEVLLAQFSLYVHKGGLKPDSFHFESPRLSKIPFLNKIPENLTTWLAYSKWRSVTMATLHWLVKWIVFWLYIVRLFLCVGNTYICHHYKFIFWCIRICLKITKMARLHRRPMSKWPDCYELTWFITQYSWLWRQTSNGQFYRISRPVDRYFGIIIILWRYKKYRFMSIHGGWRSTRWIL